MGQKNTGIGCGTMIIIAIILMFLFFGGGDSSKSGSSYSSGRKCGECTWCDGVGYSRYKDASGNYVRKTCTHCGGTGRS